MLNAVVVAQGSGPLQLHTGGHLVDALATDGLLRDLLQVVLVRRVLVGEDGAAAAAYRLLIHVRTLSQARDQLLRKKGRVVTIEIKRRQCSSCRQH